MAEKKKPVAEKKKPVAENEKPAAEARNPHQGARDVGAWFGVYVRGLAMGIAEIVPGVSGGTIAFVSGIYYELVGSLARLGPRSILLLREGAREFWRAHNLSFLSVLGLGMLTGIVGFAHLLSTWLDIARPVVWAFFLGVIGYSAVVLGWSRARPALLVAGPLGVVLGLVVAHLEPIEAAWGVWAYFFAGMLAVSAWLLPAISGSFLLLVLGLYESVLAAVTNLELAILVSLGLGCVCGLVLFANLLVWLLGRHREVLLSLLTGFMAGSLVRLWPWEADGNRLLPSAYAEMTGADAMTVFACVALIGGMVSIWLLGKLRSE